MLHMAKAHSGGHDQCSEGIAPAARRQTGALPKPTRGSPGEGSDRSASKHSSIGGGCGSPANKLEALKLETGLLPNSGESPATAQHPREYALSLIWDASTHVSPMPGSTRSSKRCEEALCVR